MLYFFGQTFSYTTSVWTHPGGGERAVVETDGVERAVDNVPLVGVWFSVSVCVLFMWGLVGSVFFIITFKVYNPRTAFLLIAIRRGPVRTFWTLYTFFRTLRRQFSGLWVRVQCRHG